MTDEQALRRFNKTAEKWRDLAEKRRLYFEELHQSGRWKYYYTEPEFYRRLGKAAELVELWEPVLKARLTDLPSSSQSSAMSAPKSVPKSVPKALPKSSPQALPKSSPVSPPVSSANSPMRAVAPPRRRAI
jgi:uncharacterized repeat protein (TIGR03809 family)